MQISRVQSQNQSFGCVHQRFNPKLVNVAINGSGEIGKLALQDIIKAKHVPAGFDRSIDMLKPIAEKLNLVMANLGSFGLKGKSLADAKDEPIINHIARGSNTGAMPSSIKFGIKRTGEKTETADNREVFLTVESEIGGREEIKLVATRGDVDFSEYNAQILAETTGANTKKEDLTKFLDNNETLKTVVLSAPAKGGGVLTVIPGVNDEKLEKLEEMGNVVSAASCTTTGTAPIAKVLRDNFGLHSAHITTIHAATNTQSVLDKGDCEGEAKSRQTINNMIPAKSGVAKAFPEVLENENGEPIPMTACAIRVPTANVSIVDGNYIVKKNVTVKEVTKALVDAANDPANANYIYNMGKGSTALDGNNRLESALLAEDQIFVANGNQVTVLDWYNNTAGYTRSFLELISKCADRILAKRS